MYMIHKSSLYSQTPAGYARLTTYPCTECHPPFQSRSKTATAAYGKEESVGGRWSLIMTSKSPDSEGGIRSTRTTGVFRALNFELFVKPVRSHFVAITTESENRERLK